MKKLMFICSIYLLSFSSCGKDKDCVSSIEEKYSQDTHYNRFSSCTLDSNGNFTRYYSSLNEFYDDSTCSAQSIPFNLNFNGIIIAQGVNVPYVGPNGGDPGYEVSVEILKDKCEKIILFEMTLKTIDTSNIFEHNENVLVTLDSIDSEYQVYFSHKIIPL